MPCHAASLQVGDDERHGARVMIYEHDVGGAATDRLEPDSPGPREGIEHASA